jgi:hypothetical protein
LRTTNGLWALGVNALGTREFADLHADIHAGVSARKQECDKAVGEMNVAKDALHATRLILSPVVAPQLGMVG